MRTSTTERLRAAATATLAPGEQITDTGICWAVARRDGVPLLFQARRQYWVVLTDRRLLVFDRQRGGPEAGDLVLGKRFDFFALESVKKVRPLLQVRVEGANGSHQVLEFRPGHRALGTEVASRMRERTDAPTPPSSSADPVADATSAAFWGER